MRTLKQLMTKGITPTSVQPCCDSAQIQTNQVDADNDTPSNNASYHNTANNLANNIANNIESPNCQGVSLCKYPTVSVNPLCADDTQALGEALDALQAEVMADLGEADARYIRRIYASVVYSEILGRGLMAIAPALKSKPTRLATWLLGTASLSLSKILNNMELGHNVLHGQYDWMQDKHLNSRQFDWDHICPAPLWQHSHNYLHHTFTNIVDRDHDVGYHLIRVTDEQPWSPSDRYNPLKTLLLAFGFDWAIGFHDIQISIEEYADSESLPEIMHQKSRALVANILRQISKDYLALPLLAGLMTGRAGIRYSLLGNVSANTVRNIWTWAVIFCGHFTEQAHIYTHLAQDESRGDWYVRQLLGSTNITGSKLFHIMTGNLSHQIEHHLFPDMPANRYASIAPKIQALCTQYHLPYNTGSFVTQFSQVMKRIYHFSLPPVDHLKPLAGCSDDSPVKRSGNSVNPVTTANPPPKPPYPYVSKRRQRLLDHLPDFLAQTIAYI